MSLHVYDWLHSKDGEISIKVECMNDEFFDMNTILVDTPIVRTLLKLIDNASFLDDSRFLDRTGTTLYKNYLSTGCKTALNIALNPNCCFNTIECGDNAMFAILQIPRGNVLWIGGSIREEFLVNCDILYRGTRYCTIKDFAVAFDREC